MSAISVLKFGHGFTLEPAEARHRELAFEWTDADPDHSGRVDPLFWLEQSASRDSYLCSDRTGPVLFFKVILFQVKRSTEEGPTIGQYPTHLVAELHMQFMPPNTQADHERIRAALLAGCPWLEQILIRAGVEEICFDSHSRPLIAFTTKRLGFTQENGLLRKQLKGQE